MPVSRAPFVVASSNITPHGVPGGRGKQKRGRKWAKGGSYRSPVELWPLPSTVGNAVSQCGTPVSYDLLRLTNRPFPFAAVPSIQDSS